MKALLMAAALTLGAAGLVGCAAQSGAGPAHARGAAAPKSFAKPPAPGTRATCPVMGHSFEVKADTAFSEHKGRRYYFCCPGCKPKFDADPAKYAE